MAFLKKFKIKRYEKKLKSMSQHRQHNQPNEDALQKERNLCHKLAAMHTSLIGKKKFPFAREMAIECYRLSASIDDSKAQFILAKQLLDEAKLRENLEQEVVFKSTANHRLMLQLYEEAHAYLQAAEKLRSVEAKRLRGLCYINAWGVEVDKDRGFELVCQSIEQENSWDKVPQIFAEIGLNKPEFFAAIMKRRKQ